MPQYSSEYLLQLLQRFLKHQNQVKQIHCLLITDSHLLNNTSSPSNPKWKRTLFYNTLIRAHFGFGQSHNTLHFFTSMLHHNVPPNSHTFPCLFRAVSSSPSLASLVGSSLHTQIIRRGVSCDPFIQTSLLCLYSDIGGIINAHKVFDEIAFPCVVEFNAMLDALGKNGDMGSAVSLFETMRKRDVVSWTSVITGFTRNGHFVEAIRFFKKMIWHADVKDCLAKPNEATYVSVLSSCAKLDNAGASYFGKEMHGYIIRNEVALTVFMGTTLIDLYGKSGLLETAIKVFEQMVVKEVCTWNAIISSLACNSRENQALEMFERMKSNGLHPNEVTFVGVLTACARAKLVELGLELFQSMSRECEFAVVPVMEHYGCVVDILGRAGLLTEAREFISRMPFEPDASVWGALLGACKIHGAVMLANDVGKRMLKLRLQLQHLHCGQYVALSHINAGAERWVHAADLRQAMANSGIKKIPAYSSINSL